jgi:hypothetical protein
VYSSAQVSGSRTVEVTTCIEWDAARATIAPLTRDDRYRDPLACAVLYGSTQGETQMHDKILESIAPDQLEDVSGGFDWKSFGGSVATWGAGGAVAGGITGAAAGGIGAGPGALAGGVGGAISGGVYNAGQQFGFWK